VRSRVEFLDCGNFSAGERLTRLVNVRRCVVRAGTVQSSIFSRRDTHVGKSCVEGVGA